MERRKIAGCAFQYGHAGRFVSRLFGRESQPEINCCPRTLEKTKELVVITKGRWVLIGVVSVVLMGCGAASKAQRVENSNGTTRTEAENSICREIIGLREKNSLNDIIVRDELIDIDNDGTKEKIISVPTRTYLALAEEIDGKKFVLPGPSEPDANYSGTKIISMRGRNYLLHYSALSPSELSEITSVPNKNNVHAFKPTTVCDFRYCQGNECSGQTALPHTSEVGVTSCRPSIAPKIMKAYSKTAYSVTGNVKLSDTQILFENGKSISIVPIDENGKETSQPGKFYRIKEPANPQLISINRLCGTIHTRNTTPTFLSIEEQDFGIAHGCSITVYSGNQWPVTSDQMCAGYNFHLPKDVEEASPEQEQ